MTWRKRRAYSYLIHEFDDVNLPHTYKYVDNDTLINDVITFFRTESKLEYPAKTYFVAIVYAYLLEKYFDLSFKEALSQPDLLFDDPNFVPYQENKYVYDAILSKIKLSSIEKLASTQKTCSYFKEEFLIGADC